MGRVSDVSEILINPPFELSETDKTVLQTPEDSFTPHSWDEMKAIIAAGDMSLLRRTPTDLLNYILWTVEVQDEFGSILNFISHSRLHWKTENKPDGDVFPYSSPIPFSEDSDFMILRNDWPYGMEAGMVHLVAWTKAPINTDEQGDPSPQSRQHIDDFIARTFKDHIGQGQHTGDNVQWFRNRTKWQSVRGLDHIHIVLRDMDEGFVTTLTGQGPGDTICKAYQPCKDGV